MTRLSVIIPANNEDGWIAPCLEALLAQPADEALDGPDLGGPGTEVIVAANACTDGTVPTARGYADRFAARGWTLTVLDIERGGKLNALNEGEAAASGRALVYLDADVICRPGLLAALWAALDRPEPRYATGVIEIAPAKTWVTRRYADLWRRLPFVTAGCVGAGLFAMNRAGRGRWGEWADIISDDTFARLNFAPGEREEVPFGYVWPMVEGFAALVKVRRRQDRGVAEVREKFPELMANESHGAAGTGDKLRLLASAPLAFCVYVSVALAVRFGDGSADWTRGR
ncbi:glycosyltransferase [Rhodovulum sp. DZ06]|uniref:glycosyltransferase n=1 Tax=Rhodovulum sp. DZ06 TaxID=3425126 RepID=UPI003D34D55E